jgi:hypothetical protein
MGSDLLRAQIVSPDVRPRNQVQRPPRSSDRRMLLLSVRSLPRRRLRWHSVIERHFGYRMSVPAMAIATYVGTSRLHDNRHFLSDVVFGSALGTATGWTIVGRHGRSSYALARLAVPGGFAFQFSHVDRDRRRGTVGPVRQQALGTLRRCTGGRRVLRAAPGSHQDQTAGLSRPLRPSPHGSVTMPFARTNTRRRHQP